MLLGIEVILKIALNLLTYGIPALILLAVAAVAINAIYDLQQRDHDSYR